MGRERELVDVHPVIMMQGRSARLGSQTIHYTVTATALLSSYKFQPLLQPSPQLVIGRITVKPRLALDNRNEDFSDFSHLHLTGFLLPSSSRFSSTGDNSFMTCFPLESDPNDDAEVFGGPVSTNTDYESDFIPGGFGGFRPRVRVPFKVLVLPLGGSSGTETDFPDQRPHSFGNVFNILRSILGDR